MQKRQGYFMPKESLYQPKTLLRQKIFLCLFGIFLCLSMLEIVLRISGFIYYSKYKLPEDRGTDYRIFCIGESSTFGIGTRNPSIYNYPSQLEKILNAKFPYLRVQCFFDHNIGINTTENLFRLPSYIEKYKPHLVIFMVGANNWWNLDKSNILIFNKKSIFSHFFIKLSVFMDRFRVYKLFKWITCKKGLMKLHAQVDWPDEHIAEDTNKRIKMAEELNKQTNDTYGPDIFNAVAFYDLMEMVRICKNRKINVVICSYPATGGGLYFLQKKAALLCNCPFVDNYIHFGNLPNKNDYFSYDRWHPNEKGYRLVAENIYNCILENKLIK
jgi:lysophospholipase L1-like esterase